jgi:RNA polymerase sigma-70 factor (ECF subfamily)
LSEAQVTQQAEIDRQLMRQLQEGDRLALEAIYKRHGRLVYTLILRIVRDQHEAEDVLEEVFFELWRSSDRFDDSRGTVQAYLVTLSRSRAIDRLRKRDGTTGKRPSMRSVGDDRPDLAASASDPMAQAQLGEQREQVKKALLELEPEVRDLIERSFYDGQSHSEIAAELNKPLGSVKTQIRRGLMTLAKALKTVKSIFL